jgi:hypothetical protein
MSGIEELRQRVSDAEERFGLFNEQHVKAGGRLIGLMNAVEERIRDQQGEIERQESAIERHRAEIETQNAKIDGYGTAIAQQAGEIEKFKAAAAQEAEENEQLRTMLDSLLQASEAGSRDVLAEAMMQLDSKVSDLMDDCAPEAVAEPEEPDEIEEPAAEEPITEEPAEIAAEVEEPIAEEPDEFAAEIAEPAAEEPDEIPAEVEESATEEPAEIAAEVEEPAAEAELVAAEGAIATGDILDILEVTENSAEDPMAASNAPAPEAVAPEPVAEEPVAEEPAAEDVIEPAAETAAPGSLDEIMERVSKLVQETDAAIAAPEPAAAGSDAAAPAEAPEEPAEEPAQQASAAGS